MIEGFKPLLAEPAEEITFPVYASVKIDGIRGSMLDKKLVSRRLKPIPNDYIRRTLQSYAEQLNYGDGEILTFTNGKMDDFNTVQSKVMTQAGKPEFCWYVFDHFQCPQLSFQERMIFIPQGIPPYTKVVTQFPIKGQAELDELEAKAVLDGWEGLMVRSPHGIYKFGRSTAKQQILLKIVRKQRAEATITGLKERMHNANEATIDERGYTERSSHKANKFGRGDLGSLDLEWDGIADGKQLTKSGSVDFNCGTGFDDALRASLWQMGSTLLGKQIVFEFRGVGSNDRPRFPAFISLGRD